MSHSFPHINLWYILQPVIQAANYPVSMYVVWFWAHTYINRRSDRKLFHVSRAYFTSLICHAKRKLTWSLIYGCLQGVRQIKREVSNSDDKGRHGNEPCYSDLRGDVVHLEIHGSPIARELYYAPESNHSGKAPIIPVLESRNSFLVTSTNSNIHCNFLRAAMALLLCGPPWNYW